MISSFASWIFDGRDFAEALDAGDAEEALLLAEEVAAVRGEEAPALAVDVPEHAFRLGEARHVDGVVLAPKDAAVLAGDDPRGVGQRVDIGDQRPREIRLDVARRDAGNGLGVQRRGPDPRRHPLGRTLEREPRLAAAAVEDYHVAGIDPVRIPDVVAVHPPDVGPPPGILEELPGDAPEGVPFLHLVAVGHPVLEDGSVRGCGGRAKNERRGGGRDEAHRCAKLLTHKTSSGRGGPCYRPKPPQNKGLGRDSASRVCILQASPFDAMALLPILEYPDPRLRKVAAPVTAFTADIQKLVRDLAETMYAAPGIGLAATQVDVHKRVIVMDLSESRDELRVFINPRILAAEGEAECEEGCLSVPGYYDKVTRAATVRVEAQNEHGETFVIEADELLAVCLQHEMDHLEGKVFVDHLSPLKRARLSARLRKKQRLAG